MYESARPPMKPRDVRRRAYALMRQCWKTLLLAAVLMSVISWVSTAVETHGKRQAMQAYNARMEIFYAENEPPTEEATAAFDAILAGDNEQEYTDEVEYASLYGTREWLAQSDASDQYDAAYRPWSLLVYGIDLIDTLFSCIIAVGLCHGLLSALRGGECTPHSLLLGWPRAGTACWLTIQTGLRVWGWTLIPGLLGVGFMYVFGEWAERIFSYLAFAVGIWATLHYCLAAVHLADDPYESCTATDALRQAVDDADAFGVWQMCRVLWPVAVLFVIAFCGLVTAEYVPTLALPARLLDLICALFMTALQYTNFVCIYDEIRQRVRAAEEAVPPTEGLARARALAAHDE